MLGQFWERQFCIMAALQGLTFTPMQIGRKNSAAAYTLTGGAWNVFTLPDVTVWTFPGQHHEIKHKAPTTGGRFGLERYRFNALLAFALETRQDVLYTIHNHALSGGRECHQNDIAHWYTARVTSLDGQWAHIQPDGVSWVNGVKHIDIPILYWDTGLWSPLADYWPTSVPA